MTDPTGTEPEDWTRSNAIRVTGIALFRQVYKDEIGELPANGTMGEIAFEDADDLFIRCPGLRYVVEAGIRALTEDKAFQSWLTTIYSGERERCLSTERALAATFPPDPEPDPNAMTPDEIVAAMIETHNQAEKGWLS